MVERCELFQARTAKQGHMRGKRQRTKTRICTDIGSRLVAADMLLAGRQGQDKTALAVHVDSLATHTAWHLADKLLLTRKQADIRTAKAKRIPD